MKHNLRLDNTALNLSVHIRKCMLTTGMKNPLQGTDPIPIDNFNFQLFLETNVTTGEQAQTKL
eukprot:c19908_g1_i2 orf=189-377(-)